jgi:small conductance mechanosensitive channel
MIHRHCRASIMVGALLWLLVAPCGPVLPQESDAAADTSRNEAEDPKQTTAATGAERVIHLESTLAADRERLARLAADLDERQVFFDELTAALPPAKAEHEEKRGRLESLDPASAEAKQLDGEVEKLATKIERVGRQADLEFKALETLRSQAKALEQKIEKDQRALEQLKGIAPEEPEPAPPEAPRTDEAEPSGSPLTGLIPGVAVPKEQAGTPAVEARPETTEQVEARQQAETRQAEAERAGQAVVEFLERKAAVEQQIAMEQTLLQTAEESRGNVTLALEERQKQLDEAKAAKASATELRELQRKVDAVEGLLAKIEEEITQRRDALETLSAQKEGLKAVQAALTEEALAKQEAAEHALRKSRWLASPFHPVNIARWAVERGPRILSVIIAAVLILLLLRLTLTRVTRLVIRRGRADDTPGSNRADTLANSFLSVSTVLIVVGGVLIALQEAGMNVTTVLGGAAILGVAIAFGAQNLMRDYFTGFMILLEDQFELGDLVTIDKITGTVERVNMRTTMLRDLEGRVHFIPNGQIRLITNRTYVWGRAVVEIPVGYEEKVDRVMEVILDVAETMRADEKFGELLKGEPTMLGVDKFTDYGVIIKFMIATAPAEGFAVRRELLRRIKNRFDEEGIEISVPHRRLLGASGPIS